MWQPEHNLPPVMSLGCATARALALAVSLLLAACAASGASTSSSTPASTPSVAASASGLSATTTPARAAPEGAISVSMTSFIFMPMSLTAKAGTVAFFLRDDDPDSAPATSHNLVIGPDQAHPLAVSGYVAKGQPAVFTVDSIAAGRYVIWCSVPNHANNGMVGTLTVTP